MNLELRRGVYNKSLYGGLENDIEIDARDTVIDTVNVAEFDNVTIFVRGASMKITKHGWNVPLPVEIRTEDDESCAMFDVRGLEGIDLHLTNDGPESVTARVEYLAGITGLNF